MWVDSILGLIAPPLCKGCNNTSSYALCDSCLRKIVDEPYPRCVVCENLTSINNLCKNCLVNSPFSRAYVVGKNEDVLKKLVYDYKLNSERHIAKSLVNLLDEILPIFPSETVVVPVPTIQNHIRQRGFGHTELIAKLFAKKRHLLYGKFLTRTNNIVMHGLKASERKKAIKSTYTMKKIPKKASEVLLIDDIYTTGATTNMAAKLLKNAGVESINLAVIARQPKK